GADQAHAARADRHAGGVRAPRAGRARGRSGALLSARACPTVERSGGASPLLKDAFVVCSDMAHPFICPNCGHRTTEVDRNIGFTRQRKGCTKCGFAFLFELLDDYFPAPDAAFFVCDGEGRVIGCGRNSFAFTGLEEEEVIGQRVEDVLGLRFVNGDDPVATVLEWGVRALEVPVSVSGERDVAADAKADIFPAYDEDGGLLLVLTPDK